jgi:SulP family sulfate permease
MESGISPQERHSGVRSSAASPLLSPSQTLRPIPCRSYVSNACNTAGSIYNSPRGVPNITVEEYKNPDQMSSSLTDVYSASSVRRTSYLLTQLSPKLAPQSFNSASFVERDVISIEDQPRLSQGNSPTYLSDLILFGEINDKQNVDKNARKVNVAQGLEINSSHDKYHEEQSNVSAPYHGVREISENTENTPLLSTPFFPSHAPSDVNWPEKRTCAALPWFVASTLQTLPALLLGLILTLLDVMSYGYLIFPTTSPIFERLGGDGMSMFLISTIISQLVFSTTSTFQFGVGSMIVEVLPFLHTIAKSIQEELSVKDPAINPIPSVLAAFSLGTLLTGVLFTSFGAARLGNVMGYFPRHILVGSIGGVGVFLLRTAIECTGDVKEFSSFNNLFDGDTPWKWGLSLASALGLRLILSFRLERLLGDSVQVQSSIVPMFFILLPLLFHGISRAIGFSFDDLQTNGWLFDMPKDFETNPLAYFRNVRPQEIHWGSVISRLPTIASLSFFSVLHVPINVPALAVSTGVGISVNRELATHGLANILAACAVAPPNYLVYSSSILFMRSGGNSRIAGYSLAISTVLVWVYGAHLLVYVPRVVVGSLMFHLGIDLFKEAVWDPLGMVTRLEYGTIWLIVICMTILGFTEGIGAGIVLACVFFVAQAATPVAASAVVAASYRGTLHASSVRRMRNQRNILRQQQHRVAVLELQGFLFFASIHHVTKQAKDLIHPHRRNHQSTQHVKSRRRIIWPGPMDEEPITPAPFENEHNSRQRLNFLILDFTKCVDIDFSAGEAFVKLQRYLESNSVVLILAGVGASHIANALKRAGVWPECTAPLNSFLESPDNIASTLPNVIRFDTVPLDLEYCENSILAAFRQPASLKTPLNFDISAWGIEAEERMILAGYVSENWTASTETFIFFEKVFAPDRSLVPLLQRHELDPNSIVWQYGDHPSFVYFVLKGAMVLSLEGADISGDESIPENNFGSNFTYLPGTAVGANSFLGQSPRSSTCWVDPSSHAVVYSLTRDKFIMADPELRIQVMEVLARVAQFQY